MRQAAPPQAFEPVAEVARIEHEVVDIIEAGYAMDPLRMRAHAGVDGDAGRELRETQARNQARVRELSDAARAARSLLHAALAEREAALGGIREGMTDAEFARIEQDPEIRRLDAASREIAVVFETAPYLHRCVDGERPPAPSHACDAARARWLEAMAP